MSILRNSAIALVAAAALTTAACTADPTTGATTTPQPSGATPQQSLNQSLHDKLPQKIKDAGKIVAVNTGSFPPYTIVGAEGSQMQGATAALADALG